MKSRSFPCIVRAFDTSAVPRMIRAMLYPTRPLWPHSCRPESFRSVLHRRYRSQAGPHCTVRVWSTRPRPLPTL